MMKDDTLPITHIPQTTMTHHLNREEIDQPMNHRQKEDRRKSTNTKEVAPGTEKELDTTDTKDRLPK